MAGVSFPGIGSGIDGSAVARSVADQITLPNAVRRTQVDDRTKENTSLERLRVLLQDVASSLESSRTSSGGALAKKAATSNKDVVTAVTGSNATAGVTNITVDSLAQTARGSFNRDFSSRSEFIISDPADAGNVSFTIGTGDEATTFSVAVDEFTTAESFVQSFNAAADGKATASLVNVGTAGGPRYRLSVATQETGTEQGNLTVSSDSAALLNDSLDGVSITQATNARFHISGITDAVERSSNVIDDVIPGVTATLKGTGTAQITVGDDNEGLQKKVENFVTAYNALVKYASKEDQIQQVQEDGERKNVYGTLARSNVDDDVISQLRATVASATSADGSVSLASLGVSTNRDGTLSFNAEAFNTAVQRDPSGAGEAVSNLADRVSGVQGVAYQFTGYHLGIDQAIGANDSEITGITDTINSVERTAAAREQEIKKQFSSLEGLFAKLNADSAYLARLFKF